MKQKVLYLLCSTLACGSMWAQKASELKFTPEGTFKIVQFADMHYVTGSDETLKVQHVIKQTLDEEKPQMVVFTGDVITSAPQQKGWEEVLKQVIERKIPWAVTLGNHDDEHDWKRTQLIDFLVKQPYTLATKNTEKLKGVTNYVLDIKGNNNKNAASIYCLDSQAYSTIVGVKGYGWFGFDQVQWYRQQSKKHTAHNGGKALPSLAFFHIPLPEYTLLTDSTLYKTVGVRHENECPAAINTGMYAAFVEGGDVMATFVGHDHDNNYIGCVNSIALAYGQYSGGNTVYNNNGAGARIIVLKEGKREFDTWIGMADNTVVYQASYPTSFVKQ